MRLLALLHDMDLERNQRWRARLLSEWLALLMPLLLVGAQVAADQRPGKHTHDDKAPHGKPAEGDGHTTDGPHQHPWWDTPPAAPREAPGWRGRVDRGHATRGGIMERQNG